MNHGAAIVGRLKGAKAIASRAHRLDGDRNQYTIKIVWGVTRGAVYWHFASKRELFQTMREQVSLPLFDRPELPGADGPDPLLAIEQFLRGVIARMESDRETRQTFDILSLKCEYVGEFRPELGRHLRRCRELQAMLAVVYRRARRLRVMRADVSAQSAALGTCVFITGLVRIWLMDGDGAVLRPHAGELIAAHIATLRSGQRGAGA